MCGGVFYTIQGQEFRYYFPNPAAVLPVKMKSCEILQLPWGRREKQPGALPLGGWARLESIYTGRWDKYQAKPVKLCISQFMEKDHEGNSHWFDVTRGQFIQGLLARSGHEQRVYVVTIQPELENAIHSRWPRILCG